MVRGGAGRAQTGAREVLWEGTFEPRLRRRRGPSLPRGAPGRLSLLAGGPLHLASSSLHFMLSTSTSTASQNLHLQTAGRPPTAFSAGRTCCGLCTHCLPNISTQIAPDT